MNRESVLKELLELHDKNILCQLPTSFGKSRIAIEIMKARKAHNTLIVVPRNVLKNNWASELKKWGAAGYNICYTTYVSFPKCAGKWDMVIFDECHHLSDRCREAMCEFIIKSSILLSATVKRELKDELREVFGNLRCYTVSARAAIDNDILPDPKVILIPLRLSYTAMCTMEINNSAYGEAISIPYSKIWEARKDKKHKYIVSCNQIQRYKEWCSIIEWYKKKRAIPVMKNIWLHHCGERLKWLSNQKTETVHNIMQKLDSYRTLIFCNSIEQTELLGEHCINSKNKDSFKNLDDFNNGNISHITAVNMLNEGVNLSNCQIGIYANLNSSDTIIKQRLGRILRHPKPIIIIPYFVDTREQEIVDKMLEDYNPRLIKRLKSIEELKI